ncbi:unnamed protein product [Durusdinium trenchii]|uniref:Uncharacterized protein n=1 Tax=Durusdinium trenchii TaxID=1381693 RepID=A0ABP0R7A5_9DINO
MASSSESTGMKSFSGDTEDSKEYRRWKVWKDASDEMSEVLTEVFTLKVAEGESLKAWISCATELFDRCHRKVNVSFPEEARGWMILHRPGLTDEEKAVVLARSLGVLKKEEIGRAMRSCYPDFTVGKLCATAISLVEDTSTAGLDEGPVDDMEEEESSAYKKIHQKPMTRASKGKENAAALVVEEGFIATVSSQHAPWLSLQLLRDKLTPSPDIGVEQLLVSSPGYGVLDSGCGRSIIGADTLAEFMELWKARDMTIPTPFDEVNHFKYGNGHGETTQRSIRVPVVLGGRSGTIKAAIVQGQAPLLVSRSALKALKAAINFDTDELTVFDSRTVVPLSTNQAGEFTVDLLGSHPWTESFAEVMLLGDGSKPQPSCEHSHSTEPSVTPESTPCADTPSSSSQDMPVLVEESLQVDAMPKHQLHQLEASVKSWMFDRLRNRRI